MLYSLHSQGLNCWNWAAPGGAWSGAGGATGAALAAGGAGDAAGLELKIYNKVA